MSGVYSKLADIFPETFDDEALVLTPELTQDKLPEWATLGHVRLILTIQQTSSLQIVGGLVALIRAGRPA